MQVDEEGFLLNLDDWTPAIAQQLATEHDITLTEAHFELIELLRDYYRNFDHAPAMRPLVAFVKKHLGEEKGQSMYLMSLFPGSPAKLGAKIAGLPKPENCL
jgi:tRNA 2-thiouridine synthesizing protein E